MTSGPDNSPEERSFRAQVLTSAKLSSLKFASELALRLVSTIVLTRLLAPEVYGVYAIVLVYLYLLEMVSDFGLRSLILTKEGEVEPSFLRTCWTVAVLRGVLILVASVAIAVVIRLLQLQGIFSAESAYANEVLPWALAAIGASTLVYSCQSPAKFVYERKMQFGLVTAMTITINIAGLVATVCFAFYLRSIWALVLGAAFRSSLALVLSFLVFHGPKLGLQLNREHLAIIIGRGKWIVGHSILTALAQSADRIVLGFVMTSSTFGFFYIARQLATMVFQFLEAVNTQMGLQVFRKLLDAPAAKFRQNFYKYRLFFDAISGISTGGLLVVAPLLVEIVFDDRYGDVAPLLQLLVIGVPLTGALVLRSAYGAERRFREMTFLSILSTGTLWLGLGVSVFVFGSLTAGLVVVALHRLPEALALLASGWRRGWIIAWREGIPFVFMGIGAALGMVVTAGWNALV